MCGKTIPAGSARLGVHPQGVVNESVGELGDDVKNAVAIAAVHSSTASGPCRCFLQFFALPIRHPLEEFQLYVKRRSGSGGAGPQINQGIAIVEPRPPQSGPMGTIWKILISSGGWLMVGLACTQGSQNGTIGPSPFPSPKANIAPVLSVSCRHWGLKSGADCGSLHGHAADRLGEHLAARGTDSQGRQGVGVEGTGVGFISSRPESPGALPHPSIQGKTSGLAAKNGVLGIYTLPVRTGTLEISSNRS